MLETVGYWDFHHCDSLEGFVPPINYHSIESFAFGLFQSLRLLNLPSIIDLNNLRKKIIHGKDRSKNGRNCQYDTMVALSMPLPTVAAESINGCFIKCSTTRTRP